MGRLLVTMALVAAHGCGSEAPTTPTLAHSSQTTAAETKVPSIDAVSLVPSAPLGGDVLEAVATVSGTLPHRLQFTWTVGGRVSHDELGAITLPKLRKGEYVAVSVVASNDAGSSEPVRRELRIGNSPPRLVDLRVHRHPALDEETGPGFLAEARASDPDDDALRYEYTWLVNDRVGEHREEVLLLQDLQRGDLVRLRVRASDGDDWSDFGESGTIEVENAPPEITSTPPRVDEQGVFHYAIQVSDRDGDRNLRYELLQAPRGMRIDPFTGELDWKPEVSQVGVHTIEIAVDDRHGGRAKQSFGLPVVVRGSAAEDDRSREAFPAARR